MRFVFALPVSVAVLLSSSPAFASRCADVGQRELTLYRVNRAKLATSAETILTTEVTRIWHAAGVAVEWRPAPSGESQAVSTGVYVIVVPEAQGLLSDQSGAGKGLAVIRFSNGRAHRHIYVSVGATTRIISRDIVRPPLDRVPARLAQQWLARALGRAAAHEVGHYHWLPAILRDFRQRCPRVDVRIDPDATRRPLAALTEGKLDLAIVSLPVKDRRLVLRPLFEDELLVVVNPAHPLGRRPFVRAEDFATETVLVCGPKNQSYALQQAVLSKGVQPVAVEEVMLTEAIVEMVKAGLGISILARCAVQPHLSARTLRAVRLTRSGYRRQWTAAICRPLADLDYIQEFVRLVEAHAPTRSAVVPFIAAREAGRSK